MTDHDLDLVGEAGTCICHNCSSNMRLRSGFAPIMAMRRRGIAIALGIDEAGINDDRDMLQEMRLVLHSNYHTGIEEDSLLPSEVFRMATEFGAKTTPFGHDIGKIEVGKSADLVLLDWRQVSFPYLDPSVPLIDALLIRGKCSGVSAVIVEGEIIFRDGQFLRVNEPEVLMELAQSLARPATKEELELRETGKELVPYIKKFYSRYGTEVRLAPAPRPNQITRKGRGR
jgi:cytosine/adenosine deaminase-related metal-dependent hydrolase